MLRQRVITALVLVAVLLGVMIGLPPRATVILLSLIVLVGAWEWAGFIGGGGIGARIAFTLVIGLGMVAGAYFALEPNTMRSAMLVAVVWWVIAFVWVAVLPERVNAFSAAFAGVLALVPCWMALVYLCLAAPAGTAWVLFTLALVWAADTGAFFAGRALGKVLLAPRVSPKKTWEGVIGGVALAGLVAWVGAWFFDLEAWSFVMLCIAVAALSIVGDLTESMLKRAAGLKDSGTVFPGHGGMLDRIDSVTAAAPALVFGLFGLGVLT